MVVMLQTKTIETTLLALRDPNNDSLPPLMNPTMLEASDDLTNLSHLNEPAGMWIYIKGFVNETLISPLNSSASDKATILSERDIHVQRNRSNRHKPFLTS
jgi:hypothetical protein